MVLSDCCTATGVACDGTFKVISIVWNNVNLAGFLNVSCLPSTLTFLSLNNNNNIGGPFPKSLPPALRELYLTSNRLNGTLPTALPTTLIYFYFNYNSVTGNLPTTLPPQLIEIGAISNQLSGALPSFPSAQLFGIYLERNYFTGPIPTIPNGVRDLDLYNNLLSGDVPIFPLSLRNLKIQGNFLSGIVYLTAAATNSAILNNNLFTGVIIYDLSSITTCDISNNPLLGSPSILNLTICTQTGLYTTSIPTTKISVLKTKTTTNPTGISDVMSTTMLPVTSTKFNMINVLKSTSYDVPKTTVVNYLTSTTAPLSSVDLACSTLTVPSPTTTRILMTRFITSVVSQNGFSGKVMEFNFNPKAVLRVIISAMLMSSVLTKTPLRRHFKSKKGKK